MVLPNFLGLGVMRSGSTWLHHMLDTHPEVFVPSTHKQVDFFGAHFDRGVRWYESFFRDSASLAVGEVTATYFFDPDVPKRIKQTLKNPRFIVILREPVSRAVSHYRHVLMHHEDDIEFDVFLKKYPEAVDMGEYAPQLQHWFSYFSREQFLILVFEEVMQDKRRALNDIALFLGVRPEGFSTQEAAKEVNASKQVRFPRMYRCAIRVRSFMNRPGFRWMASVASRVGAPEAIRSLTLEKSKHPVPSNQIARLRKRFEKDRKRLESLLGRDFEGWDTIASETKE